MAKNEFLLPNELGWQCNDEVAKAIANWLTTVAHHRQKEDWSVGPDFKMFMDVAIAELSDNVYAIIKKYQERKA